MRSLSESGKKVGLVIGVYNPVYEDTIDEELVGVDEPMPEQCPFCDTLAGLVVGHAFGAWN